LQCTQVERFVLRFPRAADRRPRPQKRPPPDRRKNLATIYGKVPGTYTDKTHTSWRVLGGLRERARPFRRVSRPFGAGSVRSAQRNIYRVWGHVRYLEEPGAHNLSSPRYPRTATYLPAPTSAPGALWTTKPPAEVPNRVPGSLTCTLDPVVPADRRSGGLGLRQGRKPVEPKSVGSLWIYQPEHVQEAIPVGRGARDASRRVPWGALDLLHVDQTAARGSRSQDLKNI